MKSWGVSVVGFAFVLATVPVEAQLIKNLEAFGNSVSTIDPTRSDPNHLESDGPKELATADFDGDGQPDLAASKVFGKVAVMFGTGGKDFTPVRFLEPPEGTGELRGIATADLNGDGSPDIAVAAPFSGRVVVFFSTGNREFSPGTTIEAGRGVRAVLSLDLDGDGDQDLLVGGPEGDSDVSQAAAARPLINLGTGRFVVRDSLALTGGDWSARFPRPVFTMSALSKPDVRAARAVVTHVNSSKVWTLCWQDEALAIESEVASLLPTRSLAVGRVLSNNGEPDLVQAARDENQILIRRGSALGFEKGYTQRLYIPGSPRAVQLADVDGDGWNDLLVVLRDYDRVVTFHNENGVLSLAAEAPVGASPRDLAAADFNGDGRIDLAVSNRRSDNISVLLAQAEGPGFERLDSVYDVDGGVSGLFLVDLNDDGRDDVVQSHVLTKEISVRLSLEGGVLAAPVYSKLGSAPVSFRSGDFNGDRKTDLVVVHSDSLRPGLSVLFGDGLGNFEEPSFLPSTGGGLFSVIVADFDNDGIKDAAVGNYDCRLSMFKGTADGSFELIKVGLFTYEARAMVVGDFDQDGDPDLAGASAVGNMTVVENDGTLLTPPDPETPHEDIYKRSVFDAPVGKGRIKAMVVVDWNGDQDEDLAINSEDGVSVFVGKTGLSFEALAEVLPGTRGASDLVMGDFDGDGVADIASACRLLSCVVILKGKEGGGSYDLASITPVPAADHIASGDIDGDGLADLAGSGEVLWVALSGRAPEGATGSFESSRPPIKAVVINEILASNRSVFHMPDGKTPDVLEFYNGKEQVQFMAGWKLEYHRASEGVPLVYTFPAHASIAPRERKLLICDGRSGNQYWHANFKLGREGATLKLKDASGVEVDSVTYGSQQEDVSVGRYTDGAELITTKLAPDLGTPNFTNLKIVPDFKLVNVDPDSFVMDRRGQVSPTLLVKAEDDVGIFTLTAVWQSLDGKYSGRLGLFDDGMHGDGASLDNWFAGKLHGVPPGAKIEFFLQATNLIDEEETAPGDPVFSVPGLPVTNYAFTVPDFVTPVPTIEISELQASRVGVDQRNRTWADYIEVRNVGDLPVSLVGLALRDSVFNGDKSHSLKGLLGPGEYAVYFANGTPEAGPDHVPFKLDKNGDAVWLVGLDELGVASPLDRVRPPNPRGSKANYSWARLGIDGEFALLPPTQGAVNLKAGELHVDQFVFDDGEQSTRFLKLAFAAPLGKRFQLESWEDERWKVKAGFDGNGAEISVEYPMDIPTRIFRVTE